MQTRRAVILSLFLWSAAAAGQPPATSEPLRDGAAGDLRSAAGARYKTMLSRLSARGLLDEDPVMLARVRRIGSGLVAAASVIRPEAASWPWEMHVTGDRSTAAFCMAGGQILVGSAFVTRLAFTDGELAMLLAHEIAHAVADHRREAVRGGMESDPAQELREARIAVTQESEADRIGMGIAYRAGWPAAALVAFFDKLAADEAPGTFNTSHPQAASRAAAARAMARALGP
jgi:Putative Zn-dependent protease, contains TPR repeats